VALIVTRVHVIFKFSGYLEKLTSLLTRSIKGSSFKGGKQDFLKVITKPLTELVVQVNTCLTVEVLAWCKELIFIYINFKVGNVRVLLLFFIMWLFNGLRKGRGRVHKWNPNHIVFVQLLPVLEMQIWIYWYKKNIFNLFLSK
jgi:hypothetical protein